MSDNQIKLTAEQMELASKLTSLQRKTVINLIGGDSQRQAYLNAGGKGAGAGADATVCKMLKTAKVKKFYDSLIASAAESSVITKSQAIERLSRSALVTITDVCDFRNVKLESDAEGNEVWQTVWTMKNSADIRPEVAAAIKSVTVTKDGPKIELHDSHGAIKQLSDMCGWNAPKQTELTGKNGAALELEATVSAPEVASAVTALMDKL